MKRFGIISPIAFLLIMITFIGVNAQDSGKKTFETKCTVCHTIGGGKLIGPDLAGVNGKYDADWLRQFIQSSQTMVKAGDEAATARFMEFNEMIMPDQPLSDEEVTLVLEYIAGEGGATSEGDEVAMVEVKDGDAENGEKLFLGLVRFEEGGASCNSCHNVNFGGIMAGGNYAKDLSESHTNMGEAGVTGILSNPPFPAMREAYDNDPLGPQEIADLAAFLGKVSEGAATATVTDQGAKLLYGGAIAVTLLMFSFSLFWIKRKRVSVNHKIHDRQLKSEA